MTRALPRLTILVSLALVALLLPRHAAPGEGHAARRPMSLYGRVPSSARRISATSAFLSNGLPRNEV